MPAGNEERSGAAGIVATFIDAFNNRDLAAMDKVLADDATWWMAIGPYDAPELRPLQAPSLAGRNIRRAKPTVDKPAFMANFERLFALGDDPAYRFRLEITSIMADGDRVAAELVGSVRNPANGRQYDNFYSYHATVRDGKLLRLHEYQDTLLVYDVWFAE